jgi:ClpP class serine protease
MSKNLVHNLDLTKPWAVMSSRAKELLSQLHGFKAELVGESVQAKKMSFTKGSTRVINIRGPLVRYNSIMTEFGCAVSYDQLYSEITEALDDYMVKNIVMVHDSPGGEVDGLQEVSDFITESSKQKPIHAYVFGTCASASYWLASATDSIASSKGSWIGCIGALAIITDYSRAMENSGIDEHLFVSDISPKKVADPKTEEGAEQIKSHVNAIGKKFVQHVADRRSKSFDEVVEKFGSGDVLSSENSLKVGMIDEVLTLTEFINKIESGNNTEDNIMSDTTDNAKDEIEEDEIKEEKSKAQEDEDIDEMEDEEKDSKKAAAFIKSNSSLASKIMQMGAVEEKKRILSILEAADKYPYNPTLARTYIKDTAKYGGDFLMEAVEASREKGTKALSLIEQDAGELDTNEIQGDSGESGTTDLDKYALDHAAKIAKGEIV